MTKFIGKLKSIDEQFIDWESHVFGFGYGIGESPTLVALRAFLGWCKPDEENNPMYSYDDFVIVLGDTVAWLMINILCHANVLDYGTSPRHGWLSKKAGIMHLTNFI